MASPLRKAEAKGYPGMDREDFRKMNLRVAQR